MGPLIKHAHNFWQQEKQRGMSGQNRQEGAPLTTGGARNGQRPGAAAGSARQVGKVRGAAGGEF